MSGVPVSVGGVQRVVTSGTFSLDGGTWQVENNVWLIGDDKQVIVVDTTIGVEASGLEAWIARGY